MVFESWEVQAPELAATEMTAVVFEGEVKVQSFYGGGQYSGARTKSYVEELWREG